MAGRVGRPALPSKVHYLHGNASKKSAEDLRDGFQPDVELPACPAHLKDEARKEYMRLGRELERYALVSKIDRGTLAMIATEWARYVWAEQKIREHNDADPKGERGLVDKSPNDYKVMSVYLQISRGAIALYLKLAGEFGLSPASRSKVQPGDGGQLVLPGMPAAPEAGAPRLRDYA